jgi:hypothetical protein
MWTARVLVASIALMACKPAAMREALTSDWFLELSPCRSAVALQSASWPVVHSGIGGFKFKIPPDFTEGEARFIHGGKRWLRGQSGLSMQYGHWGLHSFDGAILCRRVVNGQPVVEFRYPSSGPEAGGAWFVATGAAGGEVYDVLIGFHGSASDMSLFNTVISSASR